MNEKLWRLTGIALMIGGVLFAVAEAIESIVFPFGSQSLSERFVMPAAQGIEFVSWLYSAFLLLGLLGLYLYQLEKIGSLGLITFVITYIGLLLGIGSLWSAVFLWPEVAVRLPEWTDSLASTPPPLLGTGVLLSGFLAGVGWVLFGIASLLAKMLPRTALLMMMIGMLLLPFIPAVPAFLAGAGFIWLGYCLKSQNPDFK